MKWMKDLILGCGGQIEDNLFVTNPGCLILSHTQVSKRAAPLLQKLNINTNQPGYQQVAEFNSRLTYLSFVDEPSIGSNLLTRMAREFQHLSVFASDTVTFVLAGISVETSLELISHHEARISRLTTSNTKAMDHAYYKIQGSEESCLRQKANIRNMLDARIPMLPGEREVANMANPGAKATAISFTMNLKDYHSLFIGRVPDTSGNEFGVREIVTMMCRQLHELYPIVIRSHEEYSTMNNGAKYEG